MWRFVSARFPLRLQIMSCVRQEPSVRPTLDEVVGALERMMEAWLNCCDDLELPPGLQTASDLTSRVAGKWRVMRPAALHAPRTCMHACMDPPPGTRLFRSLVQTV